MAKKAKLKAPKAERNLVRHQEVDAEYLFDLCVEVYKEELDKADLYTLRDGMLSHERVIAKLEEKYKSRDRAEKRFREFAQIYAPVIRTAFKVMKHRNELPSVASK